MPTSPLRGSAAPRGAATPPAPPDRDGKRQYLLLGLLFGGLVVAGVVIGEIDRPDPAPANPAVGTAVPAVATPGTR